MPVVVKWMNKDGGVLLLEENANHRWEIKLDEELIAYFNTPQCTCRPIPVSGLGLVMIGGKDKCPVHKYERRS